MQHFLRKLPSRPLVILAALTFFVAYVSVQDLLYPNARFGETRVEQGQTLAE